MTCSEAVELNYVFGQLNAFLENSLNSYAMKEYTFFNRPSL